MKEEFEALGVDLPIMISAHHHASAGDAPARPPKRSITPCVTPTPDLGSTVR
ncbi:hypothetical protein ACLK1Y_22500 [Escherichia coli]